MTRPQGPTLRNRRWNLGVTAGRRTGSSTSWEPSRHCAALTRRAGDSTIDWRAASRWSVKHPSASHTAAVPLRSVVRQGEVTERCLESQVDPRRNGGRPVFRTS